jgi:hypothetical protein
MLPKTVCAWPLTADSKPAHSKNLPHVFPSLRRFIVSLPPKMTGAGVLATPF